MRFTQADFALVRSRLELLWSPEQIAGRLRADGLLHISHETIYRYIWNDRWHGGSLHTYLRHDPKQMRKRYGRYDSRGRLAGKRAISQRPAGAENRSRVGHLEGDTMIGTFDKHCILTLVCRKTGHTMIGKLYGRTTKAVNRRAASLIRNATRRTLSITVDNGTEFHGYKRSRKPSAPKYTSLLRIIPGSVVPTRTRTALSGSTCRSERACLTSRSATAPASPPH